MEGERSGGLHKRSAEDRGASCIAPGTESLRRSGGLVGRGAQEIDSLLFLGGGRCGREPARGGGCRRTAEPAAAGRRPPPSAVSFKPGQRSLVLLGCVTNRLLSS